MQYLNINFKESVNDLKWFLDHRYPKKGSIELVGNRHRLNSEERKILYRGVFDSKSIAERSKKKIDIKDINIDYLIIDGYNVIITIESYICGKVVFRALDGYVRDISGIYGNYTFSDLTRRCIHLIISFIKSIEENQSSKIYGTIYLDSPVSKSGELASYLRNKLSNEELLLKAEVVKSSDFKIKNRSVANNSSCGCVSTSDTVIIDRSERIIDIPDYIITNVFKKDVLDLEDFTK